MNNIKTIRAQKNLTLQHVAERANTNRSHIQKIERGDSDPSIYLAYRIAKALRAPLSKVFPPPPQDAETTQKAVA